MPFVKEERRKPLLTGKLEPEQVGDMCYLEYRKIMDAWNESPRWTTIHNEFKRVASFASDEEAAGFLAFLEFYFNHGHSYENRKKAENGDIL